MSVLDLLEKLKGKMRDHRGAIADEVERDLEIMHEQVRRNQCLKELADNPGMKVLVKEVQSYLARVDTALMNEEIAHESKRNLIAMKKAWTKVLQTMLGAAGQLETIQRQLEYQLTDE